jgi:hypothetical protein
MTILEEPRYSLIIIEHNPLLYEDAAGMMELVSEAMRDAAKEVVVLLYSLCSNPFIEDLTRNADRIFYFDEGPRATTRLISKAYPKIKVGRAMKRPGPADSSGDEPIYSVPSCPKGSGNLGHGTLQFNEE